MASRGNNTHFMLYSVFRTYYIYFISLKKSYYTLFIFIYHLFILIYFLAHFSLLLSIFNFTWRWRWDFKQLSDAALHSVWLWPKGSSTSEMGERRWYSGQQDSSNGQWLTLLSPLKRRRLWKLFMQCKEREQADSDHCHDQQSMYVSCISNYWNMRDDVNSYTQELTHMMHLRCPSQMVIDCNLCLFVCL